MMWSVPHPSPETVSSTHDVTKVDHISALPTAIETIMKALPDALFHTLPRNSAQFQSMPSDYTDLIINGGAVTDLYLLSALHRARLIKTLHEIGAIRKANEISSRAHEVVMRVLGKAVKGQIEKGAPNRPLLPGEWLIEKEAEAEAIFVASCRREGFVSHVCLSTARSKSHNPQRRSPSLPPHRRRVHSSIDSPLLLQRS